MKKLNILLASFFLVLNCIAQTEKKPIRGTWVTNVGSDALLNEQNVKETVTLCREKGLNTIFVVVWNGGVTMYPSKVVKSYIGIKQDTVYKKFDPIACIIKEGHRQGLQVHAWFEFGFSYSYQDSNSVWFKKYPHWVGRNNKNEILKKNGFYWWNAMNPEVQLFVKKLVKEVVKKYDVDGIQGDDRLPAMPAEGGYDDYTLSLYKNETGNVAPNDPREAKWLQWKADKLSAFGKNLYNDVKKLKPNCIVSWAPSLYPWSKEQYLQDWPKWMEGGYADYIFPQLYRYNIKDYERILLELKNLLTPKQKEIVFPGILTSLADGYLIKPEMLKQIIDLNRKHGFNGECLFYFECLKKLTVIY